MNRVYIPLAYIAEACGVAEADLHNRYRPFAWGVPRHWQLLRGVALYAADALPDLVEALFDAGQGTAALKLREWQEKNFSAGSGGTTGHLVKRDAKPSRTTTAPAQAHWYREGSMA